MRAFGQTIGVYFLETSQKNKVSCRELPHLRCCLPRLCKDWILAGKLFPLIGRLTETETKRFLQEGDSVSTGLTAEAVPEPLLGIYQEARRLVVVEGTTGFVGLAFLFELVAVRPEEF